MYYYYYLTQNYLSGVDENGMNDSRTYLGAEEAVRFRMVSVDLALMEIDKIQATGR